MSTRSNIIVKDKGDVICLYHHYDGYPDGVGFDLLKYLRHFSKWPSCHLTANRVAGYLASQQKDCYEYDATRDYLHLDIEYLYVIDTEEETFKCYSVCCWDNNLIQVHLDEGGANQKLVFDVNLFSTRNEVKQSMKENHYF